MTLSRSFCIVKANLFDYPLDENAVLRGKRLGINFIDSNQTRGAGIRFNIEERKNIIQE
jgi:hypothetical protein